MKVSVEVIRANGESSKTEIPCDDFQTGMRKAFLWYEKLGHKPKWETVNFSFRK